MKIFTARTLIRILVGAAIITQLVLPGFVSSESPINASFPEEELHAYIKDAASTLGLPGLSVAVSRNGELLFSEGYGKGIAADTIFYIGSVSKSFTGLAVMQLVEKGLVDLDASISTYLPAFTVSDKITVRHLLNQNSGMTDFQYMSDLPPSASFAELIADMNGMPLTTAPGEKFAYFNQNYSLLGAVIEATSGKTYEEYMEVHVLSPLGLTQTSVRGRVDVPGHLSFFGVSLPRSEPFLKYDLPGGFITSTVIDLIKYLDAIQNRDPDLGISPDGVEMLLDAQPYGMGWVKGSYAGYPTIHHGGSLPGYVANAIMLPDEGYSIALLTNKNHLLSAMFTYPALSNGIVSILTNQEPPKPFNRIWIFRILFVFFAWNVFGIARGLIRLITGTEQHSVSQRVRAVILNLALPIAVFFLIPVGSRVLIGRGMTWRLAFLMMPDLLGWLFVGMASHILTAAVHIRNAIREYRIKDLRS